LIESAQAMNANFVEKGSQLALRSVGRRNAQLKAVALRLARKLSQSSKPAERWIGKDALRDLARARKSRGAPDIMTVKVDVLKKTSAAGSSIPGPLRWPIPFVCGADYRQ